MTNVCTDPNANNTGAPGTCFYPKAAPTICADSKANNTGAPLPYTYTYTEVKQNLLISNNAALAHAEGFTGKGVAVGVVDSAFNFANMSYAPLNGKVLSYNTALTDFRFQNMGDEQSPHFLFTSTYLAGRRTGNFYGGVAPDVQLRWFGICTTSHRSGSCKSDPAKSDDYVQTLLNHGDIRLINISLAGTSGVIRNRLQHGNANQW